MNQILRNLTLVTQPCGVTLNPVKIEVDRTMPVRLFVGVVVQLNPRDSENALQNTHYLAATAESTSRLGQELHRHPLWGACKAV